MTLIRPTLAAAALTFSALTLPAQAAEFTLTSSDIAEGQSLSIAQVFNGFGCIGLNKSPQLSWSGAPADTKSFAITVYDPDAPTGSGWWHWTVFNIPASVRSLPAGATAPGKGLPAGSIQGRTDFGSSGFGGACPPEGDKPHRYQFVVWALKTETLPLDAQASGAMLGFYLNAQALATAKLTAVYERQKPNVK
ncbi:kinase inhibitor [Herbaspirillum seropedicae]|uniref:Phospholipid-binding protein n=1 Tax=Herbaspirillum seropedicae (strain SmR1) TaxID=757424 RepID=D8IZP3_HERSS|nr:kinase inhibitor [Herbaspirillum seropedicae]ADJ64383.1 phospholipid-binding protein [Herbaspirillum seropedicae SmR1]AKN66317.1 phosphatidylethanolamine-binding protein [Herbaspirillum seropedicae]NQE30575.1 phosphatidylethanolamine-binding protein [Herbaspirillum seropedicae]UMU22310.1 kinase inhibitor [Herbaspirillum seropedicae]